jgi:hypothetical protein
MSLKIGAGLFVLCGSAAFGQVAVDTPSTPIPPPSRAPVSLPGPLFPTSNMDAVLYDNGPLVTHPGASCQGLDASALQNTSLQMNVYGFGWTGAFRLADDFVVPAGQTWNVTGFELFAYLTNATAPSYTLATIQIWNGPPGGAGSAVIFGDTTTNRLAPPATFTNTFRPLEGTIGTECIRRVQRLQCNLAATLPAGTYWVDIGGGAAGFMPPVTILGQTGKPGANGKQFNAVWGNLVDTGATGTSQFLQDIPFLVIGEVGGGCYPDCDGVNGLTVADFGCFQTKFVQGDPYADCDGLNGLTVADFGCFQTKFVQGCN